MPAEPDAQTTDSVYDFLYHDPRRVGSFIAQMDASGHLTSLKQTETAESGSGMKSSAHASGSVAIARGGAGFEDQRTATERESLERTYDPLWTNALALLDMLDQRSLIQDGLLAARIGQFVKVSGALTVTDLTLWKGLWSMPALKEVLADSASGDAMKPTLNREQRRKSEATNKGKTQPKTPLEHSMEAGLALVGMLPHTIQARLTTDSVEMVWCSLKEEGLVVSASDLTLKHGLTVSGVWTMVGVLDALPEVDINGMPTATALSEIIDTQAVGVSPIGELMQHLTPAIRGILGRPSTAYGITPLVIFRQVTA